MSTPSLSMSSSGGGGGFSAADNSGTTDQSYRRCLVASAASILSEVGFDSSSQAALESLVEALQSFLCELGRSSRAFTELACRNRPLPADILMALLEMGTRPEGLTEYAFRATRRVLPNPGALQPPKPAAILHTGDRKQHRPGGVVPEGYVELPDSHSYMRTPTHKQPVTDYESVREKAASQKRDVERALTRFVAKTSKTHSLFQQDDTNLYPLVHCDRVCPDQPVLPPYVSALLFKDQIFEEDESEFAPKKKKEEESESKEDSKNKDAENNEDDVDKDAEDADEEDKKKAKEESETIDNPFLRPPKMSRPPILKR